MSAIGIDLGSSKAVMGVVKGNGVEVVLSDTSARSVPAMVAYTASERLGGESVRPQHRRNFQNTITFLTRFLGLNGACTDQIAIEKKFITHKIVTGENNKLVFPVEHMGEKHNFNIEQCLALYLVKLKEFYEEAGHMCEGVFTVPSYFSNVERQGLKDAIEIAGIKCFRLINESTAIALNYGFFRRKEFTDHNPRTVAFVDFGHSKTTITMARFSVDAVQIVGHVSDRNLGGRDFDYAIMEKIGGEFEQKFGCDPRETPRGRLRMMEAIEKARKILSADKEAGINIDFLMEEEDLNRSLKRDEFEEIIDPITNRFSELLIEALQISGINPDDLHSVELISDATRTPKVQEIIKQVYGKQELSRTLNAQDCLARGASLQAAIMSPIYNVDKIKVKDFNAFPVSMTYTYENAPEVSKTVEIFPVGTNFPLYRSFQFKNRLGGLNVMIHYSEGHKMTKGLPTQCGQYTIKEGKLKNLKSQFEFEIKMLNDKDQIVSLEEAYLKEKISGKDKITDVAFTFCSHAIPPAERKELKFVEDKLYEGDRKFLRRKQLRNELEAYSYEMREKLQASFVAFCDPALLPVFLAEINETVAWLYAAGEEASLEEYEVRVNKFKTQGEPIRTRYRFYEALPETKATYDALMVKVGVKMFSEEGENAESLINISQVTGEQWEKFQRDLAAQQKWENPAFTHAQAEVMFKVLENELSK